MVRNLIDVQLIPAVAYVRMSTDQQKDSPERQHAEIEALASRGGYHIVEWYEDHGKTGTESLNRPGFQRMLQDVQHGTFRAVLMYELSRFSREDPFDAMAHWKIFRDLGISVVTCQGGEIRFDDLGGMLTAFVGQYGARQESIRLAERSVSGKLQKLKAGCRVGKGLFGYHRAIYDETGNEVRLVHHQERFQKPKIWTTKLVPGDTKEIEAIRWAFQQFAAGDSFSKIAREFNRRGLKTSHGKEIGVKAISDILRNDAYAGHTTVGKKTPGKFASIAEGGPLVFKNSHEPIISAEQFAYVQTLFNGPRRPSCYLLSGLLVCPDTGRRMYGTTCEKRGKRTHYYQTGGTYDKNRTVISGENIDRIVVEKVLAAFVNEDNINRVEQSIKDNRSRKKYRPAYTERSRALRQKISQAENNLALADDASDFRAISERLKAWRKELKEAENPATELPVCTPEVLEYVREIRDTAKDWRDPSIMPLDEKVKLRAFLTRVIEKIVWNRKHLSVGCRKRCKTWWRWGQIECNPTFIKSPITFDQRDFPELLWEAVDIVIQYGPAVTSELSKLLEQTENTTYSNLALAEKLGFLTSKKVGRCREWTAVADQDAVARDIPTKL